MQIWDSAGQERYKSLIPSYVRGASIIFIVYDVSNKNTFLNVNSWINFIKQNNKDDSMLVLCGNKIDLKRQVDESDGRILANKENLFFFETSAKNAEGVNFMMYSCISKLSFFDGFKGDNNDLIKELEIQNSGKKEQNSFFDITKQNLYNGDLTINDNKTQNEIENYRKNIKMEKKSCGC